MLSRGNISQPETFALPGNYYPERWLSSGVPYEFTTRPTVPPPAALFDEFHRLTADIGVLGLYHIGDEVHGKMIEYTEGRKNILVALSDTEKPQAANHTETAWNLGKGDPVTMACMIVCDSRNTRDGSIHKGMYRQSSLLDVRKLTEVSTKTRSPMLSSELYAPRIFLLAEVVDWPRILNGHSDPLNFCTSQHLPWPLFQCSP